MIHDVPDLGVRHLRAVVAVARFGSFIAAASFLGISQPGLSRIVQQAESLLGAALFVRGSRSVSQTPAGREFVPVAERLLGELAQQARRARAADAQMRGQLVIASLMSIAHNVLPAALTDFRTQHPKMYIQVREGLGPAVLEAVRTGIADFGVGSAVATPAEMAVQSVVEERLHAVLPAGHKLAAQRQVTLLDLEGVPLVSMPVESGLRRAVDVAASAQGVALDHSLVTGQFATLFGFVAGGLGAAVVPATVLPAADDPRFAVKPLRPVISRRIGVLRLADRPLSEAARMFLALFEPRFRAATMAGEGAA